MVRGFVVYHFCSAVRVFYTSLVLHKDACNIGIGPKFSKIMEVYIFMSHSHIIKLLRLIS